MLHVIIITLYCIDMNMVGIICHMWSSNCLSFWNTWDYPWFLLNVLDELVWFILSNHMSSRFLVPCCDVRYFFSVETMFGSSLLPFGLSVVYIFSNTTGVTCWAGIANPSGHLSSPPVIARVARCLFFYVMFYTSLFAILSSSFGHCIVCPSFGHCIVCPSFGHCIVCPSIYGIWLPL